MNVLLTGASGFLGASLKKYLETDHSIGLSTAVRSLPAQWSQPANQHVVGDINSATDWRKALKNIDVVIHCAARVHVIDEADVDPLKAFRLVNVQGTLQLAQQAAKSGVRRFIFISSIKVHGEVTRQGQAYKADDEPNPVDAYGRSKWEAEQALMSLSQEEGMEIVIIRPPLIYGPGVKANFLSLMKLVNKGIPLPLGSVANYRSLVFVDNLVDLIATCVTHPGAANQVFLVSDGEDLSTTQLLERTANALGVKPRLLKVPVWLLKSGAALIGKKAFAQRLCESLRVDISKTQQRLNWSPRYSVDEGLRKTAQAFLESKL